MNNSNIPPMVARLRADPFVQEMVARNAFQASGAADMIMDMNQMSAAYRRVLVERWCQTHTTGRWRRRVIERRGYAVLDKVTFEFEIQRDLDMFQDWLADRAW